MTGPGHGGGGGEPPPNPNRPLVTGVSPKEGYPGTKVTIRGEKLGKSQQDLVGLQICGVDCHLTAEWFSPNKIVAKTLLCKGIGDIVVVTGSGGIGTSTVQFKGMQEASIGPHKESAVWVEETVSVGPRPLSMAAYTQEDPLQLSSEGNDNKFPIEELLEFFPEGSGNLRADNFVPAWFLLENHHMTSFEDLKYGLKFLDRKVKSQTEGKLSFLKENVSSVMDQLDALLQVKDKFDRHVERRGTGFLTQLDESMGVCEKEAGILFQEVLTRKDRADVTRNALNGFQRFRFLFSLPGSMERNIQRGEYDSAINDYIRAKTLFEAPEMDKPIFRKFRHEIEIRVQNLQETLWIKLVEKPPNSDEQRRFIGYLVTLQAETDPAWAAIFCHFEFLGNSMKNCFTQFSTADRPKENLLRTPSKPEAHASYPNQVQFIDALSDIFVTYFPDFWTLCLDYFNGKLPVKCEVAKQQEVKEMMTGIVQLFSKLVSSCLFSNYNNSSRSNSKNDDFSWAEDKAESMSEWLPHCLSYIRDVFTELLALDPPVIMLDIIRDLLFRVRSYSLETMLHQMSLEVADLYKQETWASEPNGNHGFITQLPFKYETQVLHSAKLIKETLLQKYSEEMPLLKSTEVRDSLTENMGNALAAFSDALEMLISQNENASSRVKMNLNAHFQDGPETGSRRAALPSSHSASLLLILNNCSFTKETILPQIQRSLIRLGFPDMSTAITKAKQAINVVEKLTFAKYTEMKYEPVVGQVEQSMYSGHFDWENCSEPINVRPYISKTLLGMIDVVAEVSSVSEKLVSVVMTQVVENVCEELTRLFSCVPKFSEFGVLQATLDILAFQEIVEDYLNATSRSLLKETFGLIPRSSDLIKHKKVQQLLEDYRKRTKLQYYCFASSATGQVTVMIPTFAYHHSPERAGFQQLRRRYSDNL